MKQKRRRHRRCSLFLSSSSSDHLLQFICFCFSLVRSPAFFYLSSILYFLFGFSIFFPHSLLYFISASSSMFLWVLFHTLLSLFLFHLLPSLLFLKYLILNREPQRLEHNPKSQCAVPSNLIVSFQALPS